MKVAVSGAAGRMGALVVEAIREAPDLDLGGVFDPSAGGSAGVSSDPEVVRADVRDRLEQFGPDASLVFTQVHNIQYDVPPENILALRDEFFRQTRA